MIIRKKTIKGIVTEIRDVQDRHKGEDFDVDVFDRGINFALSTIEQRLKL